MFSIVFVSFEECFMFFFMFVVSFGMVVVFFGIFVLLGIWFMVGFVFVYFVVGFLMGLCVFGVFFKDYVFDIDLLMIIVVLVVFVVGVLLEGVVFFMFFSILGMLEYCVMGCVCCVIEVLMVLCFEIVLWLSVMGVIEEIFVVVFCEGDLFVLCLGVCVFVDGVFVIGEGMVDEVMIIGELMFVLKVFGVKFFEVMVNFNFVLIMCVSVIVESSIVVWMIDMVIEV